MGNNNVIYWEPPPKGPDQLRLPEPHKTKMVEPARLISRARRERALKKAFYNVFNLKSEDIYIDLLTDSGTNAMSQFQWAEIMRGDESYAGSASFDTLRDTIEEIFGFRYVLPAHQGRSAELVLMTHLVNKGDIVPGNMHFDTTSAHIEFQGGIPMNFPSPRIFDLPDRSLFKGDIEIDALTEFLKKNHKKVPLVVITATCNTGGGQPVSMRNVKETSRICRNYNIPLFIDAARVIENAYFIREYEPGFKLRNIKSILKEMMSYATGMIMSAKKDGLVNIGGFIATNDAKLFEALKQYVILFDGFITYGGLAGRDLLAIAQGLREACDLQYLKYRVAQVSYLALSLEKEGIKVMMPPGGHAVYVCGASFCPHLKPSEFPAQALTLALYLEGGVRACEVGTILAGRDPITHKNRFNGLDLMRLAIPRRVYSFNHLDYVIDCLVRLKKKSRTIRGVRFVEEAKVLRHFSSKFALI